MLRIKLLFSLMIIFCNAKGQTDLPLVEFNNTDVNKPFVFYLSGDGGMNDFSTSVCKTISERGYAVTALNCKSYFWSKKTPEQAAAAIGSYLTKKATSSEKIVLVGYSFGADVLPFIINRLPEAIRKKITSAILVAPSTSTDFEIHLSDMLGRSSSSGSMNVVAEMNLLTIEKTVVVLSGDEKNFPVQQIKLGNFFTHYAKGGHHFDGNTTEVANTIISYF